jgi:hypothetical protein
MGKGTQMTVWMVRAGSEGEQEPEAHKGNFVTIHWQEFDDLSAIHDKEALKKLYSKKSPDATTMQVAAGAGQVWAFCKKMEVGDLAVLPLHDQPNDPPTKFAIGEVIGPYRYRTNMGEEITHTRKVKWIGEPIPATVFRKDLLRSLGRPPTVYSIDAEARIRAILATGEDPGPDDDEEDEPPVGGRTSIQEALTDAFIETDCVQETEDLVPNLRMLTRAMFGDNAYLVSWRGGHTDWATLEIKYGDGLVWLPWSRQLWLIEVEWKEGSNFFQQARAFAKGKVNSRKLSQKMRDCLSPFESALNDASSSLREGHVVDNLVRMTLDIHVEDGWLCPHAWVILGHERDNIPTLLQTYEQELRDRFHGEQQYILSMVRLFGSSLSRYALIEQHCSDGCGEMVRVQPAILVPFTR